MGNFRKSTKSNPIFLGAMTFDTDSTIDSQRFDQKNVASFSLGSLREDSSSQALLFSTQRPWAKLGSLLAIGGYVSQMAFQFLAVSGLWLIQATPLGATESPGHPYLYTDEDVQTSINATVASSQELERVPGATYLLKPKGGGQLNFHDQGGIPYYAALLPSCSCLAGTHNIRVGTPALPVTYCLDKDNQSNELDTLLEQLLECDDKISMMTCIVQRQQETHGNYEDIEAIISFDAKVKSQLRGKGKRQAIIGLGRESNIAKVKSQLQAKRSSYQNLKKDVFDELLDQALDLPNAYYKIAFPFCQNNSHWYVGEIRGEKKGVNTYAFTLIAHDPYGGGDFQITFPEDLILIRGCLSKRLGIESLEVKSAPSPFKKRRQQESDGISCGPIMVDDLFKVILGHSLDVDESHEYGAISLRNKHVAMVKQHGGTPSLTIEEANRFLKKNVAWIEELNLPSPIPKMNSNYKASFEHPKTKPERIREPRQNDVYIENDNLHERNREDLFNKFKKITRAEFPVEHSDFAFPQKEESVFDKFLNYIVVNSSNIERHDRISLIMQGQKLLLEPSVAEQLLYQNKFESLDPEMVPIFLENPDSNSFLELKRFDHPDLGLIGRQESAGLFHQILFREGYEANALCVLRNVKTPCLPYEDYQAESDYGLNIRYVEKDSKRLGDVLDTLGNVVFDPASISRLVLTSLLINPENAEPNTFRVVPIENGHWRLVAINPFESINPEPIAAIPYGPNKGKHRLITKNILYLLPNILNQPLDKGVRQQICNLIPERAVAEWISAVDQYNQKFLYYLTLMELPFARTQSELVEKEREIIDEEASINYEKECIKECIKEEKELLKKKCIAKKGDQDTEKRTKIIEERIKKVEDQTNKLEEKKDQFHKSKELNDFRKKGEIVLAEKKIFENLCVLAGIPVRFRPGIVDGLIKNMLKIQDILIKKESEQITHGELIDIFQPITGCFYKKKREEFADQKVSIMFRSIKTETPLEDTIGHEQIMGQGNIAYLLNPNVNRSYNVPFYIPENQVVEDVFNDLLNVVFEIPSEDERVETLNVIATWFKQHPLKFFSFKRDPLDFLTLLQNPAVKPDVIYFAAKFLGVNLNQMTSEGTLLCQAVKQNDIPRIKALIENGADTEIMTDDKTALDIAIETRNQNAFKALLTGNVGSKLQKIEDALSWYIALTQEGQLDLEMRESFRKLANQHQKFAWLVVLEDVFPQIKKEDEDKRIEFFQGLLIGDDKEDYDKYIQRERRDRETGQTREAARNRRRAQDIIHRVAIEYFKNKNIIETIEQAVKILDIIDCRTPAMKRDCLFNFLKERKNKFDQWGWRQWKDKPQHFKSILVEEAKQVDSAINDLDSTLDVIIRKLMNISREVPEETTFMKIERVYNFLKENKLINDAQDIEFQKYITDPVGYDRAKNLLIQIMKIEPKWNKVNDLDEAIRITKAPSMKVSEENKKLIRYFTFLEETLLSHVENGQYTSYKADASRYHEADALILKVVSRFCTDIENIDDALLSLNIFPQNSSPKEQLVYYLQHHNKDITDDASEENILREVQSIVDQRIEASIKNGEFPIGIESLQNDIVKGADSGARYLKDGIKKQLWSGSGEFPRANKHGRRSVRKVFNENGLLGKEGILFVKKFPEFPGHEAAVSRMMFKLIGHGAPYSDLFNINGNPYLVSQGQGIIKVDGQGETGIRNLAQLAYEDKKTLDEIIKNKLDNANTIEMILMAMLLNPEDGKLDNYVLAEMPGMTSIPEENRKYQLISVDNDHAFAPLVIEENGKNPVHVKTFLFAMKQAMESPISSETRKKFRYINPTKFIQELLDELQILDNRYSELFNNNEDRKYFFKEHESYISIPFTESIVSGIYDRLMFLQDILASKEKEDNLKPADILGYMAPVLATESRYGRFWHLRSNPLDFIQDSEIRGITTSNSRSHIRASFRLPVTPALVESAQNRYYTANQSWEDFRGRIKIINQAITANPKTPELFREFYGTKDDTKKPSRYQLVRFLKDIDFSQSLENSLYPGIDYKELIMLWSDDDQRDLLKTIKDKDHPLSTLTLRNCYALTVQDFMPIRNLPFFNVANLYEISVSGCQNLNADFINLIANNGKGISYLDISDIAVGNNIGSQAIPFELPKLKRFLRREPRLKEQKTGIKSLYLKAPNLLELDVSDCDQLENIELIECSKLEKILFKNVRKLNDEKLDKIVKDLPKIESLDLGGTQVTEAPLRAKFPKVKSEQFRRFKGDAQAACTDLFERDRFERPLNTQLNILSVNNLSVMATWLIPLYGFIPVAQKIMKDHEKRKKAILAPTFTQPLFVQQNSAGNLAQSSKIETERLKYYLRLIGVQAERLTSTTMALRGLALLAATSSDDIARAAAASAAATTGAITLGATTAALFMAGCAHVGYRERKKNAATRQFIGSIFAEALKENKKLRELIIPDSDLGSQGAKKLTEALKNNSILTTLNLSKCDIGNEGAEALADAVESNSTLTSLDLSDNRLDELGTQHLLTALNTNTVLSNLELGGNKIKGTRQAVGCLNPILPTTLTSIQRLIHRNQLKRYGANAIGKDDQNGQLYHFQVQPLDADDELYGFHGLEIDRQSVAHQLFNAVHDAEIRRLIKPEIQFAFEKGNLPESMPEEYKNLKRRKEVPCYQSKNLYRSYIRSAVLNEKYLKRHKEDSLLHALAKLNHLQVFLWEKKPEERELKINYTINLQAPESKANSLHLLLSQTEEGDSFNGVKRLLLREESKKKTGKDLPLTLETQKNPEYYGLSIDGGGVRGLIPALMMQRIEQQVAEYTTRNYRIHQLFDYVGGTSIGGILALGVSIGDEYQNPIMTTEDSVDFFKKKRRDIFSSPRTKVVNAVAPKYDVTSLENLLKKHFKKQALSDALVPVVITGTRIDIKPPSLFEFSSQEFKTHDFYAWQVALATSAAPIYFPSAKFKSLQGDSFTFWDGGLSMNNPSQLVLKRIKSYYKVPDAQVHILSLGTGETMSSYTEPQNSGIFASIEPIIRALMAAKEENIEDFMSQHQLYKRIQITLCDDRGELLRAPLDAIGDEFISTYEDAVNKQFSIDDDWIRHLIEQRNERDDVI